jgi:hypothetical protein
MPSAKSGVDGTVVEEIVEETIPPSMLSDSD